MSRSALDEALGEGSEGSDGGRTEGWRNAFLAAPEVMELPTDRPRPARAGLSVVASAVRLPAPVLGAAGDLGAGVDLASALALWELFLTRVTGRGAFPLAWRCLLYTSPSPRDTR